MSMNIFDITGDLGTTSKSKEYAEWSVEAMQEEINAIAEMHNNMDDMETAEVFYKACEAEMNLKLMAAMEAEGVEDASKIFAKYNLTDSFSQEAAKDVLAREAYRGIAKIKTLIAAIIKFVQEFITFGGTISKAYAKLKKLAKSIRDGLKKKAGSKKVQEDKFTKEIYNLTDVQTEIGKKVANQSSNATVALTGYQLLLTLDKKIGDDEIDLIHDLNDTLLGHQNPRNLTNDLYSSFPTDEVDNYKTSMKEITNEIKDLIEDHRDEYEKNDLLTKAIENASIVYTVSESRSRDRSLKTLEKFKKAISKLSSDRNIKQAFPSTTQNPTVNGLTLTSALNCIQLSSQLLGIFITTSKKIDGVYISTFDRALTECKAVEAMAA